MTIREARPDDLDRLVAVNRAAATAAYAPIFGDTPYPGTGVRRRYQRMLGNPCVRVFVAEQDQEPLGYAAARAGRLEALYVVPGAWGSDVADALYEHVAPIAGRGATLWVLRDNARGRRFWERHGWRATGEEDATRAVELLYRREP